MKKLQLFILTCSIIGILLSCKKDEEPTLEEIQQIKIDEVIPSQYVDTLKNLGFQLHEGTTPPNVEGIYLFSPIILKASNVDSDYPGMGFIPSTVKFYEQNSQSFEIKLLGKNFLNTNDTSIVTAISGSGKNFTVYGKVKASVNSVNYAYFAIVMSGYIDNGVIKNMEYGLLNIDNTHGGGYFIGEGQARIIYEEDKISEVLDTF